VNYGGEKRREGERRKEEKKKRRIDKRIRAEDIN
jgi:hypothetical protein